MTVAFGNSRGSAVSTQQDIGAVTAALASRICHDLVSPLGAIGNGLELLEMAGQNARPELDLIGDSVRSARARLQLFRLAFGTAGTTQRLPITQLRETVAERGAIGRISCTIDATGDLSRADGKLLALALMCLSTGLPWGGQVLICRAETGGPAGAASGWRLVAEAGRTRPDPTLWSWLDTGSTPRDLPAPAEIHFALLAFEAAAQNRTLGWELDDSGAEISF